MYTVKSTSADIAVGGDGRTVEAYASTFNNVDLQGDVIRKGAFQASVSRRFSGKLLKVFLEHRDAIGVPVEAPTEDDKGLWTISRIGKTAQAKRGLQMVKDGIIQHMSIGFNTLKSDIEKHDEAEVRAIKEVDLWEYSLVVFPANELASITGVKSLEDPGDLSVEELKEAMRLRLASAEKMFRDGGARGETSHLKDSELAEIVGAKAALQDLAAMLEAYSIVNDLRRAAAHA